MEKYKVFLVCKECRNTFEYDYKGSGKKPDYCPSCRKLVNKKLQQKYKENKEEVEILKIKSSGAVIDTTKNKAESLFTNYTTQVLDLLGQLDSLRVNMCNLVTELSDYQSNYDKKDQEFIHTIELNNFRTGAEALQFINEWSIDRKSRRNVKCLIKVLRDIIGVIPLKNKMTALNNISNIKLKEKINDTRRTNL